MTATSPYLNHPVRTEREAQLEAALKAAETALVRSHESHAARIAMDSEHSAQLEAENARLREALDEIVNPLSHMKMRAEAEGKQLSGIAYSIANDPHCLREIARAALSTTASKGGGDE